ncbi:hypothetical protein ACFQHO_21195 [Actinomadura yumaensis]
MDVAAVQRLWPDIIEAVKQKSRVAWMVIMSGVRPVSLDRNLLTLAFDAEGARTNFANGGRDAVLREVLKERMGVDWRVDTVLAGSEPAPGGGGRPGGGGSRPGGGSGGSGGGYGGGPSRHSQPANGPAGGQASGPASGSFGGGGASGAPGPGGGQALAEAPAPPRPNAAPSAEPAGDPGPPPPAPPPDEVPPPDAPSPVDESDEVDPEGDADADGNEAEMNGMALIQRELGGQIIREIDNS